MRKKIVKMSIFEYDKEVEEAKHRAVLQEVEGGANRRAEEAEERAKEDRERADQAEQELAILREKLARLGKSGK